MTVIVRDFRTEDAAAVSRVRHATLPHMVTTPESIVFRVATANPARKYRLLIAEKDGEIIGTAHVGVVYDATEPGLATVTPHVHPDHQRLGAGTMILRVAEEYLAAEGATTVYAWAMQEPAALAFAEKHGYRPTRSAHFQRLDLAKGTLPAPGALPAGVELRTALDFEADPRPLFLVDAEASSDEPGDISVDLAGYDDWFSQTWSEPLLDRGLTTVVVVDGEAVAFTAAFTDGGTRYASGMTGTLRAHRGRGYAKLAKTDSLHRARAAGYTDAFTSNDADNGPMLAINRWFGYEICATEVHHVRTLG